LILQRYFTSREPLLLTAPFSPRQPPSFPTRRSSDLQPLYHARQLDKRRFPYVEEKSYEYPVVAGLLLWVPSLFVDDKDEFFYAKDRKSTRLNSSHVKISYAVFCLKKKNNNVQDMTYP